MRLRVTIDGAPAFLDIEGPFTVTPIYVSAHEQDGERIPPVPKSVKRFAEEVAPHLKPKSKKRRGFKRDCAHCGRTYIARSGKSVFCSDKHRHAWMRAKGYKYPMSAKAKADLHALTIHAGATGVDVKVDE